MVSLGHNELNFVYFSCFVVFSYGLVALDFTHILQGYFNCPERVNLNCVASGLLKIQQQVITLTSAVEHIVTWIR